MVNVLVSMGGQLELNATKPQIYYSLLVLATPSPNKIFSPTETSSGSQQSLLCSKKEGEEDDKSQCWFSTSVANGSRKSEGPRGYKGYQNE